MVLNVPVVLYLFGVRSLYVSMCARAGVMCSDSIPLPWSSPMTPSMILLSSLHDPPPG